MIYQKIILHLSLEENNTLVEEIQGHLCKKKEPICRHGYILRAKCKAYAAPNLWLICIREVENDS